jgi:hypothetical protein
MKGMKAFYYFFLVFILVLFPIFSSVFAQDTIPDDFCLTDEEVKLYNMVNEYREAIALPGIPVSKSLSWVARRHAMDLDMNKPDTNTCNFHSWSNKGFWTACCYEKESKDKTCMTEKPKEITGYMEPAYEIVYWENKSANASRAFNQWRETSAARSLMTNFKAWESFEWNALGVAVYKGFAILWFGEVKDNSGDLRACSNNKLVEPPVVQQRESKENRIINSETGRFYVIVGSFTSLEEAKTQLTGYLENGFQKAKIIIKDDKHRISLSDYSTMEQATKAKNELPVRYKDAWILAF